MPASRQSGRSGPAGYWAPIPGGPCAAARSRAGRRRRSARCPRRALRSALGRSLASAARRCRRRLRRLPCPAAATAPTPAAPRAHVRAGCLPAREEEKPACRARLSLTRNGSHARHHAEAVPCVARVAETQRTAPGTLSPMCRMKGQALATRPPPPRTHARCRQTAHPGEGGCGLRAQCGAESAASARRLEVPRGPCLASRLSSPPCGASPAAAGKRCPAAAGACRTADSARDGAPPAPRTATQLYPPPPTPARVPAPFPEPRVAAEEDEAQRARRSPGSPRPPGTAPAPARGFVRGFAARVLKFSCLKASRFRDHKHGARRPAQGEAFKPFKLKTKPNSPHRRSEAEGAARTGPRPPPRGCPGRAGSRGVPDRRPGRSGISASRGVAPLPRREMNTHRTSSWQRLRSSRVTEPDGNFRLLTGRFSSASTRCPRRRAGPGLWAGPPPLSPTPPPQRLTGRTPIGALGCVFLTVRQPVPEQSVKKPEHACIPQHGAGCPAARPLTRFSAAPPPRPVPSRRRLSRDEADGPQRSRPRLTPWSCSELQMVPECPWVPLPLPPESQPSRPPLLLECSWKQILDDGGDSADAGSGGGGDSEDDEEIVKELMVKMVMVASSAARASAPVGRAAGGLAADTVSNRLRLTCSGSSRRLSDLIRAPDRGRLEALRDGSLRPVARLRARASASSGGGVRHLPPAPGPRPALEGAPTSPALMLKGLTPHLEGLAKAEAKAAAPAAQMDPLQTPQTRSPAPPTPHILAPPPLHGQEAPLPGDPHPGSPSPAATGSPQ
ncbi:mucin-1-like [Phyllostomus hastatus]|uniref:mucin-1-like n=1 Tax=Phyllostomus hastatus TaxID=9423 RepID=UPI001E680238|nr:mucin-1-like [Phyllostomus hastatus]